MAEVVVSQKVTTDDIVKAYEKGLHPQGLAEKFAIPVETVMEVINKAFPQDVDGEDVPVKELAEGENPGDKKMTTETAKA